MEYIYISIAENQRKDIGIKDNPKYFKVANWLLFLMSLILNCQIGYAHHYIFAYNYDNYIR